MELRKTPPDRPQRVNSEAGLQLRFDIGHENARTTDKFRRARHPRREARHSFCRFERILRADQPPHKIKVELPQRQFAGVEMPLMRRIE